MSQISRARRFKDALKRNGAIVQSKYYAGGHNALFADSAQNGDTVRRIADFVRRHATR